MGMFDDIQHTMPCPLCGSKLTGFQSKDGYCSLQRLTPVELAAQADPGLHYGVEFYTSCGNCRTWVEVKLRHDSGRDIADRLLAAADKETP